MSGPNTSPYSSKSISGYNSSPPADDGSEVEANRVTWETIKTKLPDPVKTLSEAINTELVSAFGKVINTDADEKSVFSGTLALDASELTISSGSVTATRMLHTIDTESDAASDDLDNIAVTGTDDYAILILQAANTARTVVCKHESTGTGELHNADNTDFSLDDDEKFIAYLRKADDDWYELFRSNPAQTKEMFIMIAAEGIVFPYDTLVGQFVHSVIGVSDLDRFVFFIPNDFNSLTSAAVVVIPDATETITFDVNTDFGANGEAFNAHSDSIVDGTLAATASQIGECDVSDALTDIAANDYVGMTFASDTASIRVIGLRIKYT